ncbi:rod shape-determining protein MreC [Candidatus Nomurabacteria bacterium]|nr:rod shape-determining protein MreC [Candidatus Nomurabacteria bacterium]
MLPLLAVGGALVLLMVTLPWLFSRLSALMMTPVVRFESWLSESSATVPSYFRDRNELLGDIEDLQRELESDRASKGSVQLLQSENADLRALLGTTDEERIAAGVIGRPTALPYDVLVIDQGSKQGVTENAPVYSGSNTVIGFVAAVYSDTSVVTLVTTPGFTSTVYIYGPDIYTTAEGLGGGMLRVRVPQGILLSEGDLVILPSLGSGIYGTVSVVESIATEPEQYGYVSTETPISSLRFVSVGIQPLASLSFEEAKEVVDNVRRNLLTVPVPSGVLIDTENLATSTATSSSATSSNDSAL